MGELMMRTFEIAGGITSVIGIIQALISFRTYLASKSQPAFAPAGGQGATSPFNPAPQQSYGYPQYSSPQWHQPRSWRSPGLWGTMDTSKPTGWLALVLVLIYHGAIGVMLGISIGNGNTSGLSREDYSWAKMHESVDEAYGNLPFLSDSQNLSLVNWLHDALNWVEPYQTWIIAGYVVGTIAIVATYTYLMISIPQRRAHQVAKALCVPLLVLGFVGGLIGAMII